MQMSFELVSQTLKFENGLRAYLYVEDHFISFDGYVYIGEGCWHGLSLLGLKSELILPLIDLIKSLPKNTTYEDMTVEMNKFYDLEVVSKR